MSQAQAPSWAFRNGKPATPEQVSEGWSCKKRTGEVVPFDTEKIRTALAKCFGSLLVAGVLNDSHPCYHHGARHKVARAVVNTLAFYGVTSPGVEDVQRLVIQQLWAEGWFEAAEHYQNYREERRKERESLRITPESAARIREDQGHFPTHLQYYQFVSKFARWRDTTGRRETWKETVYERVIPWFQKLPLVKDKLSDSEWTELSDSMYWLEASPAMRVVQMAGPALDRCGVGSYNCSASPISDLFSFPELLYILMSGTGAGFSVESDYVDELPRVKKQRGGKPDVWKVKDSTDGWCEFYYELLKRLWDGHDLEADVSEVRKAGSRLKTKGGRASGPGPLLELTAFARGLIKSRQGRYLEDIDAHDLACMTGRPGQLGGVRRAALISLSDLNSVAMRGAKSGPWYQTAVYRSTANNSAVYDFDGPPPVEVFMEEWLALVKSGSGERGIFNRRAVQKYKPRRRKTSKWLTNPCQPAFASVLTPDGLRTMGDIGVGSIVWTGTGWTKVIRKIATGTKPVFRFSTTAGSFVGTACHHIFQDGERVRADEADRIDTVTGPEANTAGLGFSPQDIVDGWVLGDGTVHKASNNLVLLCLGMDDEVFHSEFSDYIIRHRPGVNERMWEVRTTVVPRELPRTWDRRVPDRFKYASARTVSGFLRGLYAANGSVCGGMITLKTTSIGLVRDVQEMLSSLGIPSYYTTNKPFMIEWDNGCYESRQSYDVNITSGRFSFQNIIGFVHPDKKSRIEERPVWRKSSPRKRSYDVTDVEPLGVMPVYDITVKDDDHCYWSGGLKVSNCAEIILRPYEFCNLSMVIARPDDTVETLRRKVRLATIFGTMQATVTNFNYIRPEWKKNCEEERLLGVDITGQADCPLLQYGSPGRSELLRMLAQEVETVNREFAVRFGINPSAANTCVKPGGDSAVLFNCSSGVSPRFADYQVRWVRESKDGPVAKFLLEAGVPSAPAPENPDSLLVFGFPIKSPLGSIIRDQMTARDQFLNWLDWKQNWAEHSVSTTIYVEDHEWPSLGALVYERFDEVTGIAFLPKDNGIYTYAPNEAVTSTQYEKMVAEFPDPDWSRLPIHEPEDMTEASQTLACVGDVCAR
jgi:ribonucleotide reductase class II